MNSTVVFRILITCRRLVSYLVLITFVCVYSEGIDRNKSHGKARQNIYLILCTFDPTSKAVQYSTLKLA